MKISSSTHMTIIFTFAIVFVALYLYYTITDVRKMSVELKKTTQDLATMTTTVAGLTKDINEIKVNNVDVGKMFNMNEMLTQELNGYLTSTTIIPSIIAEEKKKDDDTDSIDTSDIKKMLNEEEDEEEEKVVTEKLVVSDEEVVA